MTIAACGVLAGEAGASGALAAPATNPAAATATTQPVTRLGTVNFRGVARTHAGAVPRLPAAAAERRRREPGARDEVLRSSEAAPKTGLQPPTVPGQRVSLQEVRRGFEAISSRDSTFLNGTEVEPPDQGLCGGRFQASTVLMESVNLALAAYDTDGDQLTPPVSLNSFFGLAPFHDPATNRYGPFLSDPKCYFDPDTGHWFHSVLEIDLDPQTGEFGTRAATLLAVSTTTDPLGGYTIYAIDATDPNHPHCPCFGDQPLLGADANGIYLSTAEYSLAENFSNGAQIYALDKRALAAGGDVTAVQFATNTRFTATVQPATAPSGRYETRRGGTEYFMSGFDCLPPDCRVNPGLGNRITVWALTNTSSLRTRTPALSLSATDVTSEVYGQPVPQVQRPGPLPLGQALGKSLPLVNPNDVRMNQVVYAKGRLWSGINTVVRPGPRDGIAWFVVNPSIWTGRIHASIARQGYVAAKDGFVSFPSVAVNDAGRGVIAYSLIGPGYYPSAAWSSIDTSGVSGPVRVARQGFRPEDGFTCYPRFYPPGTEPPFLCRWGDYSAAFALPTGEVWSGTEFIGDDARTTFANWSTFLWPVKP